LSEVPKLDMSPEVPLSDFGARKGSSLTSCVGKREFRSTLPAKLFHAGFKIVPVFLEIGDYILTDGNKPYNI